MIPKTIEDFEMLKTLEDHPNLDFWTEIGLNRPVDIMVVPHFRFDFVEILKNQGMENSVMIPNVQYLIDQERAAGDEIRKNMNHNRKQLGTFKNVQFGSAKIGFGQLLILKTRL